MVRKKPRSFTQIIEGKRYKRTVFSDRIETLQEIPARKISRKK